MSIRVTTFNSKKIDDQATLGLLGTSNSLSYRVTEIERHLHSGGRWFGAATSPAASTNYGDRIGAGILAYQITAADNTWGSWLGILGSSDTPVSSGFKFFDPHQLAVTTADDTHTYFIQFSRGATGDAGVTAGKYTEFVYTPATNRIDAGPIIIQTGRSPVSSIVWARCMVPGQNGKKISFYMGLHEYEG